MYFTINEFIDIFCLKKIAFKKQKKYKLTIVYHHCVITHKIWLKI